MIEIDNDKVFENFIKLIDEVLKTNESKLISPNFYSSIKDTMKYQKYIDKWNEYRKEKHIEKIITESPNFFVTTYKLDYDILKRNLILKPYDYKVKENKEKNKMIELDKKEIL